MNRLTKAANYIRENSILAVRILNVLIIIAACLIYQHIAVARAEATLEITAESNSHTDITSDSADASNSDSLWKDGTYQGSGTGYGGEIQVEVTISGGTILDITVLSAPGEDSAYLDNARSIISHMITSQSSQVDTASGATFSSRGIIEAVTNALKEAEAS